MSSIFLPYVYHESINHKFYLHKPVIIGADGKRKVDSVIINTGIRLPFENEYNEAFISLLDLVLLYDVCYIPVDDLIYLYAKLGKDDTDELIKSGAVKFYDALSNKMAVFLDNGKYVVFNDHQSQDDTAIEKRIIDIVELLPDKFAYQKWYTKFAVRHFKEAFFINDLDSLLSDNAKKTLGNIERPDIVKLIEDSPTEISDKVDYQQIKLNRILHFYYYTKMAKKLNCDYIYIPVELENFFNTESNLSLYKDNLDTIFERIRFLEDIPDIYELIKNGKLDVNDIIEIRSSKEARKFREWISIIDKNNPKIADQNIYAKLYFQACTSNSKIKQMYDSNIGYLSRTIAVSAIGSIIPGMDIGLSVVDRLVSKGLDKNNPSSYVRDKLRKFINQK